MNERCCEEMEKELAEYCGQRNMQETNLFCLIFVRNWNSWILLNDKLLEIEWIWIMNMLCDSCFYFNRYFYSFFLIMQNLEATSDDDLFNCWPRYRQMKVRMGMANFCMIIHDDFYTGGTVSIYRCSDKWFSWISIQSFYRYIFPAIMSSNKKNCLFISCHFLSVRCLVFRTKHDIFRIFSSMVFRFWNFLDIESVYNNIMHWCRLNYPLTISR